MTDLGLLLLLRAEDTKIGKSRKVLPDCFVCALVEKVETSCVLFSTSE